MLYVHLRPCLLVTPRCVTGRFCGVIIAKQIAHTNCQARWVLRVRSPGEQMPRQAPPPDPRAPSAGSQEEREKPKREAKSRGGRPPGSTLGCSSVVDICPNTRWY